MRCFFFAHFDSKPSLSDVIITIASNLSFCLTRSESRRAHWLLCNWSCHSSLSAACSRRPHLRHAVTISTLFPGILWTTIFRVSVFQLPLHATLRGCVMTGQEPVPRARDSRVASGTRCPTASSVPWLLGLGLGNEERSSPGRRELRRKRVAWR